VLPVVRVEFRTQPSGKAPVNGRLAGMGVPDTLELLLAALPKEERMVPTS